MIVTTTREEETAKAAQTLAKDLKEGNIILLNGTLGAGKTVFARALIRALCKNDSLEVLSPTFTLVQTYESEQAEIHHYDLYRLEDPEEILQIGWEDSLAQAITIVEWPERLGPHKPIEALDITITIDENTNNRTITINRHPAT